MAKSKTNKVERRIAAGCVGRVPALGGDVKATLVVRLDLLNRLAHKAENSVRGRAKCANGAVELVLERPHPMAGQGPLAGGVWKYPAS